MKIPWDQLSDEALRGLVEEYVSREGTEYGEREIPLSQKVSRVVDQLRSGEAWISYDPRSDSATIVPAGKDAPE